MLAAFSIQTAGFAGVLSQNDSETFGRFRAETVRCPDWARSGGMMAETSMSIREWQEKAKGQDALTFPRPFIVCPKCGNKRCPHATDRQLECTGSNDPGQPGSYYE